MLDWQSHKKLRILIRTICIVLIVTFVCYDLTWAGAGEVFSSKNRYASQESLAVEIPQELGVIKDSYTSKYNPHKLVIHIQDAHANVEAQQNEAKLIQYLEDKYKVHLVSVEGGFGDFDAGFFRSFPKDKKVRDKIAKYFLSKAFISGTDYLLVTEDEPPTVYGAEDKELYASHLNTFKENQAFSDSLNKSIRTVEDVVDTLKNKYYSKDLTEFTAKTDDFRLGRLSLEEYISYLNIASIIQEVDLSKFFNLSRIINLQELEHKINFEKAESERQDLIDSLTKALPKADLEELVKRSLDFKANKVTPSEYYSYLEKLTQGSGINPAGYNNLFTYIKYINLSENLDNSKIFEEIDAFSVAVKDRLTTTSAQRDIDQVSSIIRILKGLSNINLSPKDYEYFKGNREVFNSKAIAALLRRYTNSSVLSSLPADSEVASLEKFYTLAHERDDAIVRNSLNRLNRDYSSNSVVIVAGGFHTQGLTSILKEKDISYVVIAPSIKSSQEKENTYFALLKDKRIPLEDVLNDPDTLQIINSISDPEARQILVNYWVARASRYYSVKELQAQLDRLSLSSDDQKAVELALREISPQTQLAKEEQTPITEVKPKEAVPVVQGPTLFERLASFISSLKPKPKETKLTKQETIPASHTETKEPPEGVAAGKQGQIGSVPAPALAKQPTIDLSKAKAVFNTAVTRTQQGLAGFGSQALQAIRSFTGGVYAFAKTLRLPKQKESKLAVVKAKPGVKVKPVQIAKPQIKIDLKPFFTIITALTLSLYFNGAAFGQDNSAPSRVFAAFGDLFNHTAVVFLAIAGTIGYFAYRIIKKFTSKDNTALQGVVPVIVESVIIEAQQRPQAIRYHQAANIPQAVQLNHNLSLSMRQELENRIQQLSGSVAQGSKDALVRSFRPVGPAELPLPMSVSMLNQDTSDRDKVVHILENMQRMMDGTDEKVLRDFERAIDNARDRVTEQALEQFDSLSDEGLYHLLTDGYIAELEREFQRIIENQIQHMIRFHAPTPEEQVLYVSEEIEERYGRLPRYLKWILTNNSQIENDPLVQEWLNTIQRRMTQIPAFPEMMTGYSKVSLNKSLYLNPEIARRVLLYLAKKASQDINVTEGDVRREIQAELARNMPEDVIEGQVVVPEEEGISELPAAPPTRALPAPNMGEAESQRARLKALTDDYSQFLIKFREQGAVITKVETDLRELGEGLEEAKRQNDRIVIEALQPAVDGLTSKLRKVKEKLARSEQEKSRYEEQISTLRRELGETGGTALYTIEPVSLGVIAVFTVMFGIPLYITKKILNKWFNTTAGKTLGMTATIGSLVAGYYTYLSSLSPKIEKIFTDPANADWPMLATFFIIWPVAIFSGVFGGKIGKGISHERLYWKANSEFKKGNIDEAISLVNQAINLNPKNAVDYSLLAECQRTKKHFDDAVASYKKAVETAPNNSTTHNNLGVVYSEKGDTAKAIESYKRSLELEANDPMVLANLGRALHGKGQLLEAVRAFQRAQEIKPDSSVTEELSQILQQTGNIPKSQKPQDLEYAKTLSESLRIEREKGWVGQLAYDDTLQGIAWLGALVGWVLGGIFLYYVPFGHHWDLGDTDNPKFLGVVVWVSEIVIAPLLGAGLSVVGVWIGDKVTSVVKTVYRFLTFPLTYRKLQKVNLLPSDELSDRDISNVASIYARMSKEYLEKIFRSWMEAGQEEKVARLFKFGDWKSEKTKIYGDIGEYKRVSRVAATKFATTAQEQKVIFDGIDREKENLTQKGVNNAVGLMKGVLPQITEQSRSRDEFWHWLTLVVGLPKNILDQGSRQVLPIFTDLREFDRAQEESLNKFGANQESAAKVRAAINGLVQKLEKDGLNYPGILKRALADINKASRNLDEFSFWVNELMHFDKQLWSSNGFLGLLQNLIAYVRTKEEATRKLCHNPEETSQLFQATDSLREELRRKQVSGDVSLLKDVIPRVAEASRSLAEFFEYIAVLKAFDKNMWYGTQSVLQAFNNHVAYKQARENAAAKFTQDDASRQKLLSDIDNLRNQLVQKGFPQASDLLKDILPELTKTCRSKEEFIYWLGELVGLNTSVWKNGTQAVVNNFNDLAGFKQAKEMALDKLCASQQEKDDLARVIDSLKAKLEEKRPSCAGLIKDVILEILKDIDTLANQPYRKNDFVWWLTMCVNFEAQAWAAGTKQVLAGYQELKEYIKQRRELSARFAANAEEQQRLTAAWDNLDKAANFTQPASIGLLRNALGKTANVSANPREFTFWIGTFSELKSDVLEALCRDIEAVFGYYKDKVKARDFNHLPAVLNQYYKIYHQTILITPEILDTITDQSIDIDKRIEKAYQFIVAQKIVKLGAPPNLVGLQDIVSFEQLLSIKDVGESGFRAMLDYHWQEDSSSSDDYGGSTYDTDLQPIRQIVPKMGRDGLYSYWESQHPAYYQQFLEESKGLAPGFNRPEEKFRVPYDGSAISLTKEEEAQVMPIADNVQALRQLIQYLRMEWPNLYDNFIEPKRELIKDRPLEEFVTSATVLKMAQQLLNKVQNWQFSEQQRAVFLVKIMEIFAFQETADLRISIAAASDNFNRLKTTAAYWERVCNLTASHSWLQEKSKYYKSAVKIIKDKTDLLNNKLVDVGEGVLQFYLSGHTMADFFRGSVSAECTRYGGVKFKESIGQVTDPSFFLFKIIEKGKWVGNVYTVVAKTDDGKFALFLDWFQMARDHQLVGNGLWEGRRAQFMTSFFAQLKSYLASQGFDYLIVTTASAETGFSLYKFTQEQAKKEANNNNPVTTNLKKLSSNEHLREGSLPVEYIQNFGGNVDGAMHPVSGYRIILDKTTPQVLQQKQKDLDYLEKLLGEMSSEETRLASLAKERREELTQLNRRGQEAANSGKNAVALALKEASDQKTVEIQKIEYELGELRMQIREKKDELGHIGAELGLSADRSSSPALGVRLTSFIPLGILSSFLFANKAQAQDFSSGDWFYNPFTPFLFVAGVAGFFGLLYYVFNKLFPQTPERGSYYERGYSPRPIVQEYKLPDELKTQLSQVLDKLSPEARGLLPGNIDIRIPFEVGISRIQAVKALRLLFSSLINQGSILDFFKDKEFYISFRQRARELGLADDFDQPQDKSYFFSIPKEQIRYEEDRRAEEFVGQYLNKIRKTQIGSADELLEEIHQERARLLRKELYKGATQTDLYTYYQLLLSYASLQSKAKLDEANELLSEKNYLGALSVLEEFFRIDIGGEIISLEENTSLRDALNRALQKEIEDIRWQFNRCTSFQANKQQVIREAKDIQFELRLSERNADDVLRGVASGDCTSINGSAFYNTIPQFMFDPGLLVFRVIQEGKWVGNVYTIVSEKDGNPVLIIDAMQLPVWGRSWPISVKELSDKVLEKVVEYASSQGFTQVLMSSFVSNFNAIHDHFDQKYPATAQEIEKTAGFEHLKSLGLWDNYAARNEYLETFSPHWNYSLKRVEPNNPKQTLLLRTIWQRNTPEETQEIQPVDSGEGVSLEKPAPAQESDIVSSPTQSSPQLVKKNTPRQGYSFRNFCTGFLLAAALLLSSGCASTFQIKLGPLELRNNTALTLNESKDQSEIFNLGGKVSLGAQEGEEKTEGQKSDRLKLGVGANTGVGPVGVSIEPSVSVGGFKPKEGIVDLRFNISPSKKTKPPVSDKAAEQLKSYSLKTSGRVDVLPVMGEVTSSVGLSDVPKNKPPIEVKAGISLRTQKIEDSRHTGLRDSLKLNGEASARIGAINAEVKPSVALKELKDQDLPFDLQGNISPEATEREEVKQEVKETTNKPEAALEQSTSAQAQTKEEDKSKQIDIGTGIYNTATGKISTYDGTSVRTPDAGEAEWIKNNASADTQQIITQISGQIESIQAALEKLRQSDSNLKIEVSDLKTQLADAQKQLQQLKTSQQLPKEATELQEKKADYERQIATLEKQHTQAQEELNRILVDKEKASQEVKQLQSEAPVLQQKAGSLQNEVKQLEAQKKQGEQNLTQLQSQKSGLENSVNQLSQDKGKLQQDLSGLKQQIGEAKTVLDEAKIKSEPTLKNVWVSLPWQGQLGIILLGLTGIGILVGGVILWRRWARFKNLSDRVKGLQQQADDLERQLFSQRKEKEDLAGEIEQKKAQAADLEAARRKQEEEVKKITDELSRLRAEYQRTQEDITQAKAAKNKAVEELDTKITELKPQVTQKEELAAQPRLAPQAVNRLQERIDRAEEDLKRAEAQTAQIKIKLDGLNSFLKHREATLNKLIQARAQYEKDNRPAYVKTTNRLIAQAEDSIVNLRGQIAKLNEELAQSQAKAAAFQERVNKVKGSSLQKTVVSLQEERKQKSAQADQQIQELTQQKERLTQEIIQLEKDLEAKRQGLSLAAAQEEETAARLREGRINYEQAIKSLKQKIDAYQEELKALEQQKDKARQELSALQDTSAAKAQIEALNKQLQEAEENLRKVKEETAALNAQKKQLEEDAAGFQTKNDGLKKETTTLNQKVQELTQAISSLEVEKGALVKQGAERAAQIRTTQINQQIESLNQQKEELYQQIAALQNEIKAKQKELSLSISEAEANAKAIREEITNLTQELASLREEREKLKAETAGLKVYAQDVESKKQELLNLGKEKQNLQEEIRSLEAQRAALRGNVDRTQQELEEAKRHVQETQEAAQDQAQQKQLDAQRQSIQAQINALEEEFTRKKQEHTAEIVRLEQEKAGVKAELDSLIAQRDKARQELAGINAAAAKLIEERDRLLLVLRGLEVQRSLLQETITELKEEEAQLRKEIEALKKAEEIKPEADALLAKARAISKEVSSLYLHEKARSQSVDTFVSLIRQRSHTGSEEAIRQQLKAALIAMGAKVILECGPQCGSSDTPKNLVVEFPGTGKFSKEPGFIINAHMDTITTSTPEEMGISDQSKGFYHKQSGSLGADDKGGLTVLFEALRFVKANYWDKGVDHRRIVFIITAEEEPSPVKSGFARGAQHLASRHSDIFKNMLFSLTSDGPLDYDISDPDNSFAIVVSESDSKKEPYNGIIKTIQEIGISKGRRVELTTEGLGMGDFAHFPKDAKADLHIRSPYEGNHSHEKVKIRNLIDHVDLWIGLMLKYSCGIEDIIPKAPSTSGMPKAIIFDLDKTLSRTLRTVPPEILEQIRGFLKARIKIAIITAQSMEEVKTYLIEPLRSLLKNAGDSEEVLSSLYIGPSEGSQLWQFYTQGQFKAVLLDDATMGRAPFDTEAHRKELQEIIRNAIKEVINPRGNIPVLGPILTQDPGVTFIHNRDISLTLGIKESTSADQRKELIERIKRKIPGSWQEDILVSGGGTIHIVSKGVDKSTAVGMFRNYLPQEIEPRQILIVGDDFGPSGLDRRMVIPGAKVYSVGAKHNIPEEVEFYDQGGDHGWQRTLHLLANRIKTDFAGAAKGKGMFSPDEHMDVNEVIMAAQRERRGNLIWGDASGWQDNCAKYAQDIAWVISSLKRYPSVQIPRLGKVNIPDILSAANIVLIVPRNNSPPGLLVNSENSYQIAHNGLSKNSIYIDQVAYEHFYTFEIAVLLAHEAILLGAKKLAAKKGIPWTEQLARDVSRLAEEYETGIVGKSEKIRGSRFDERIEEVLEFNKPKPKETKPVIEEPIIVEPPVYEAEEVRPRPVTPSPQPKLQEKKPQAPRNNFTLDFPDTRDNVIDGLRKLFLEGMFRDTTNLPARLGDFPPPMAREIKESYDLHKVKGMPIDPDFLAALTVFFSRIFPNHANELINYLRSLDIYIIDNGRSTFGATLSGNTFYIQRSCLEDLLGRPISIEEINQGIKNRDQQTLVALFRIVVHEIGSAFFKLSHPANQDLEKLFLALLSKIRTTLSLGTQEEFRTINSTVDLGNLVRVDWASKKARSDQTPEEIRLNRADMVDLLKEVDSKLINSLYSPKQTVRNNAAKALVQFGAVEALPFLRLLLEKEPDNQIVSDAVRTLEDKFNKENAKRLKEKTADPFAKALFTIDENDDLVLDDSAIQAINMLCIYYDGITLEIDADTLIDTSKGIPQLKGLGFDQVLASICKAQEAKRIPENVKIRIININPALDKAKIIKTLGLTDQMLKLLVSIPDIPQDYVVRSLEPYLLKYSIRVIFEDNLPYWGKKVDVLVKRGEEAQTLSSLGLIVAGLAKEPKFYESLPQDLKEYIEAVTDKDGKVVLDDEGKIKQLIFKPIEKSKVDTQYLDKLDKANKELEGMV